jgi:hypothetical protein
MDNHQRKARTESPKRVFLPEQDDVSRDAQPMHAFQDHGARAEQQDKDDGEIHLPIELGEERSLRQPVRHHPAENSLSSTFPCVCPEPVLPKRSLDLPHSFLTPKKAFSAPLDRKHRQEE